MKVLPRVLTALLIFVSGLALTPYIDVSSEVFRWQLYADVYEPPPVEVSIEGFAYVTDVEVIPAGTTVRWTNNDSVNHTVTSSGSAINKDGDLFDSGTLKPGETFEFYFDTPGTFNYFCVFHPSMTGRFTVVSQLHRVYLPLVVR